VSTTYRISVHCDERKSVRCYGLIQAEQADVQTPPAVMLDLVTAALAERGWLRSYGEKQTWDVCPACATAAHALVDRTVEDKETVNG